MGTKVIKDKEPLKPIKLPPTPNWTSDQASFVTFKDQRATITAEWSPVAKAESYYVEVSEDLDGIKILQSVVVAKNVTSLQVQNLPAGTYYATIASIDSDQFESIPNGPRKLVVTEVEPKGDLLKNDPPTVRIGTKMVAPQGIKCGEKGKERRQWTVKKLGDVTYDCIGSTGDKAGEFKLVSSAPQASFAEEATVAASGGTIDLTFEDGVAYKGVVFESDAFEIKNVFPADENTLRINLGTTAQTGAGGESTQLWMAKFWRPRTLMSRQATYRHTSGRPLESRRTS